MFPYDAMHAAIMALRQKQIFFVGGSPKSGTTWLQLLLNAHPSVSCSGEGHFPMHLWSALKQALDQHDSVIQTTNKEVFTELPEYNRLTMDDMGYIFATCIAVFLVKQSQHRPVRAVGDKTPANVRAFAALGVLFPRAKFIQIIRDGRDCAVSGWFHNLRNPEWMHLNRGSLTDYLTAFTEMWVSELVQGQKFAEAHPNRIRRIRYGIWREIPTVSSQTSFSSSASRSMRRFWRTAGRKHPSSSGVAAAILEKRIDSRFS